MNCYDMIYGNDYYDLIVRNTAYLPPLSDGICGLDVGNNYTILFVSRDRYPDFRVANYHYNAIPNCYQPLSMEALDAAGILQVRENPALGLDGKGVLIGFLDSGIDTIFGCRWGKPNRRGLGSELCGRKRRHGQNGG